MAKSKATLCDLTEKLLVSNFIRWPNLQIILEAKSMDEFSWIFFSRGSMHGFGFQNDLKIWSSNEVRHNQFFCQITKCSFRFCHLTSFAKETNFSVKSSWEVHWILMFQKDAVCFVWLISFMDWFYWFLDTLVKPHLRADISVNNRGVIRGKAAKHLP